MGPAISKLTTPGPAATLSETEAVSQGPAATLSETSLDSKLKKKICCACPNTKKLRDECIVEHGEVACNASAPRGSKSDDKFCRIDEITRNVISLA